MPEPEAVELTETPIAPFMANLLARRARDRSVIREGGQTPLTGGASSPGSGRSTIRLPMST
jgi:hypothetical protein